LRVEVSSGVEGERFGIWRCRFERQGIEVEV
jgi:hypothetical protein